MYNLVHQVVVVSWIEIYKDYALVQVLNVEALAPSNESVYAP